MLHVSIPHDDDMEITDSKPFLNFFCPHFHHNFITGHQFQLPTLIWVTVLVLLEFRRHDNEFCSFNRCNKIRKLLLFRVRYYRGDCNWHSNSVLNSINAEGQRAAGFRQFSAFVAKLLIAC
jgi:hypothetical protein